MDKFVNITNDGNEKAIKRGIRVPQDAVNMAWVSAPKLTPENNIIIVDTSRSVQENVINDSLKLRVMYADGLGVLQDESGNQLVQEEYPCIADTFSIDEDFSVVPGSEYKSEHVLPFVHTSRYFHLDHPGLTLGTIAQTYHNDVLRVVDENNKEYVNENGERKYRIQIVPANQLVTPNQANAAYRVLAYVDTDLNENLYLTYNKIELTAEGYLTNQNINYREMLNPISYYLYKPEESDVVDMNNRKKRWYSSKPLTLKQQVLNVPHADVDGYKIYVPKKAIPDPRTFQLFRWRVVCDMIENYQIDPGKDPAAIRAAILVTNSVTTDSPYSFYNMELSNFNSSKVKFINPISEAMIAKPEKSSKAYWTLNLDTATTEQLQLFDVLLLAPATTNFDTGAYNAKIKFFTETLGRTLIVETNNKAQLTNFGFTLSHPADTTTGNAITPGPGTYAKGTTIRIVDYDEELVDGAEDLGGWEIATTSTQEIANLSPYKNAAYTANGYVQYIISGPEDYETILAADRSDNVAVSVVMKKTTSSDGKIIISTIGFGSAPGALFSPTTGRFLYVNNSATIQSVDNYSAYTNASSLQGVMKLFFNAMLLAVKSTPLNSTVESKYSSSWQFASSWTSSWVIDGKFLFPAERDDYDFVFAPRDTVIIDPVWQRKLSNKTFKQLIDESLSVEERTRTSGAARRYKLEFTNSQVKGPVTIGNNQTPYAYTEAFTVPFEVPVEIGAHVIKQEFIKPDYDAAQYIHRSYPPKPFKVNIQSNYNNKHEAAVDQTVMITALGHGNETYDVTTTTPGTPGTPPTSAEGVMRWTSHGSNQIVVSQSLFEFQAPVPVGMRSWDQSNYYSNAWGTGHECWPHIPGLVGRYSQGSSGDVVKFIQEAMNRYHYLGYFNSGVGYLDLDGSYGSNTATAVRNFQTTFQLRYIDGVVDAETFGAIGNQTMRSVQAGIGIQSNPSDHTRFFAGIPSRVSLRNMSDGNSESAYAKRSWDSGGPSIIWDIFGVVFNSVVPIHGITFTPYVSGSTRTLMWRSIDVKTLNSPNDLPNVLSGYNADNALITSMPHRPADGEAKYVPIGPYTGNTVIIGIGQDGSSGYGSARSLGVKEIVAHTAVTPSDGTPGTPGTTTTDTRTRETAFIFQQTYTITTGQIVTAQLQPPASAGNVSGVVWTNITANNPKVIVTMDSTGYVTLTHNEVTTTASTNFVQGPVMPSSTALYYIDDSSRDNRVPESGFISKSDGIKLLCDVNGNPAGFPALPTAPTNSDKRAYVSLTVNNLGKDPSILVGFYDFVQKEFIVNKLGVPEISYADYIARGPQNIYVGLISTYEVSSNKTVPPDTDPPLIPFRWAMPVYGICTRTGSNIGIEPLPTGLGPSDVWSIPIRTGSFNKQFEIRSQTQGGLVGWIGDYAGSKVRAFYSVIEAERGGWSSLHGRPYTDIVGETPLILDDRVIQVRQAPIHLVKEPTVIPGPADPVTPMFWLYLRENIGSPWVEVNKGDILDYNASDGTIFLRYALESSDPNLIKVDYTTGRRVYPFKQYNGTRLNLNPYPGHTRDLIGKPIYVYIVPAYVKDSQGRTIAASIETKTVRFTFDTKIFNRMDPQYNPLAIQLGVIYITSALDIEDLTILDTRRRGGGIDSNALADEVLQAQPEARGYWDIGFGGGLSYQKGGFVIIRLPEELKTRFTLPEIKEVIDRNITVGVAYRVEDLFGNEWT